MAGAQADQNPSAARRGIERVADEVCKDLTEITTEGNDLGICTVLPFYGNARGSDSPLKKGQNAFKQFLQRGFTRVGGVAMKAQGLSCDIGDAGEFLLSRSKVLPTVGQRGRVLA
jgi:hypothetical protein